jgi:hypothetical protein
MCYNGFKNYDEMFSNVHANRFGLTETCSIYLKKNTNTTNRMKKVLLKSNNCCYLFNLQSIKTVFLVAL